MNQPTVVIKGCVTHSKKPNGIFGLKVEFVTDDKELTKILGYAYTRSDGSFRRVFHGKREPVLFKGKITYKIKIKDRHDKVLYYSSEPRTFQNSLDIEIKLDKNVVNPPLGALGWDDHVPGSIIPDFVFKTIDTAIDALIPNGISKTRLWPIPIIHNFSGIITDAMRTLEGDLDSTQRFKNTLDIIERRIGLIKHETLPTRNDQTKQVKSKSKNLGNKNNVIPSGIIPFNDSAAPLLMIAANRIDFINKSKISHYPEIIRNQLNDYSKISHLYSAAKRSLKGDMQSIRYYKGLCTMFGYGFGPDCGYLPPPYQEYVSGIKGIIVEIPEVIFPVIPPIDFDPIDPCVQEYMDELEEWDHGNQYEINEISPEMRCPNEPISIRGTGFGDLKFEVRFNKRDTTGLQDYIDVEPEFWTDTLIIVKVPNEAGCGSISLRIHVATSTICGYLTEIYRPGTANVGFVGALPDINYFYPINQPQVFHNGEYRYMMPPGENITFIWSSCPAPLKYITVDILLMAGNNVLESFTGLLGEGLQIISIPNYASTQELICKFRATNNCGTVERDLLLLVYKPAKVSIKGIEVTQVTQFLRADEHISTVSAQQSDNSIPLISGKPTLARVYFAADYISDWTATAENITVVLFGYRNGQLLQQQPLRVEGLTARTDNSVSAQRGSLNRSANFRLPYSWVDSEEPLELFARLFLPENGPDELEWPHQREISGIQFKKSKSLKVVIVRVDHDNGGAPDLADCIHTLYFVRNCYPIHEILFYLPAPEDEVIDFDEPLDTYEERVELYKRISDLAKNYDGDASMVWCGILNDNVSFGGLGDTSSHALGVACFEASAETTAAHEIGHAYGLDHPIGTNTNPDFDEDEDFPNYGYTNRYSIGEYGVDVNLLEEKSPEKYGEIMSYFTPKHNRWFSPYYYNKLISKFEPYVFELGGSSIFEIPPKKDRMEQLFVCGEIETNSGKVQLEPLFHAPAYTRYSYAKPSEYRMVLLDSKDGILWEEPILQHRYSKKDELTISQAIPYNTRAVALEIRKKNEILKRIERPEGKPELTDVIFNDTKSTIEIKWSGKHSKEKTLYYGIAYTYNEGKSWRRLKASISKQEYSVDKKILRGGKHCFLRVYATDGFNTIYVESDRFELPLLPPEIIVINFRDGESFPIDKSMQLRVVAISRQSGSLPENSIRWESVEGKVLERGSTISVRLKPGINEINVVVEESPDCIEHRRFKLVGK